MIAVEIPAALADHPEAVPVDAMRPELFPHALAALVGQRVALAWREACPTCDGTGCGNEVDGVMVRCGRYGPCEDPCPVACPDCGGAAERMVVGWTAEVEAVVPIVRDPEMMHGDLAIVNHWNELHALAGGRQIVRQVSGVADWSPGRYALVLRDMQTFGDVVDGEFVSPMRGRPFCGFVELDQVLA